MNLEGGISCPLRFSRRRILRASLYTLGLGGALALASCAPAPTPSQGPKTDVQPSPAAEIDLGLSISSVDWETITAKEPSIWQKLPEAPRITDFVCPDWSPSICFGKSGSSFEIGLNPDLAKLLLKQAGLAAPVVPVKVGFSDQWGPQNKPLKQGNSYEFGYTALAQDKSYLQIVIWLKMASLLTFKILDRFQLPLQNFAGQVSAQVSEALVHELAHAGKEFSTLRPDIGTPTPYDERLHQQIHAFNQRYRELLRATPDDKKKAALLVAVAPVVNILTLKNQVTSEAQRLGVNLTIS